MMEAIAVASTSTDDGGGATACDALFVMAYDGEFWDNIQCVVTTANCSQANAPLELVEYGAQQYLAKGVPPEKLFLGLPWYGLSYETVAHVPFWVSHVDYKDVVAAIEKAGDQGSVAFDAQSSTNVFDCGGLCSQWSDAITDRTTSIWFDDAASLRFIDFVTPGKLFSQWQAQNPGQTLNEFTVMQFKVFVVEKIYRFLLKIGVSTKRLSPNEWSK